MAKTSRSGASFPFGNGRACSARMARLVAGSELSRARSRSATSRARVSPGESARPRNALETLAAGQVVSFFSDELVTVKSQDDKHPFHAAVYMTGSQFNGGIGGGGRTLGDADFVNIVPADQFLDRYVFFADHTYPETSLTVVRRKTATGFLPVELACAGEITTFRPLGTSGEYEYAWVHLTRGFTPQPFAKGTCGYGRHEASSSGPFSVTVWGTGRDASYGYPSGMGSRPVNNATPPPVR